MRRTKLIIATLLIFAPFVAGADLIVIDEATESRDNGVWNVTLIDGTFAELEETLTAQSWWNDDILARLFADALGIARGNVGVGLGNWGPLFAVTQLFQNGLELHLGQYCSNGTCETTSYENLSVAKRVTFATAARVLVPEPGTLLLLAVGLVVIGTMRRQRFWALAGPVLYSR